MFHCVLSVSISNKHRVSILTFKIQIGMITRSRLNLIFMQLCGTTLYSSKNGSYSSFSAFAWYIILSRDVPLLKSDFFLTVGNLVWPSVGYLQSCGGN